MERFDVMYRGVRATIQAWLPQSNTVVLTARLPFSLQRNECTARYGVEDRLRANGHVRSASFVGRRLSVKGKPFAAL